MSLEIRTTAQVGKSLSIKRQKAEGDDEGEIVVAQLSFSDAAVKRDEADVILGVTYGWTERLFDEMGTPGFRGALDLHGKPLDVTAVVGLTKGHRLKIADGELSKVALEFEPNGFLLSGTFTWAIAGDESADVEDLLGKLCNLTLTVSRRQADLFAPAVSAARRLDDLARESGTTMTVSDSNGRTIAEFGVKTGETISSASEAMKLLEKGWDLHADASETDYHLQSPDGKARRRVWINAARSCIKRNLVCSGDNVDGFRYVLKRAA